MIELPEILTGMKFSEAIAKYGYDRYRFDGDGIMVQCRLWKTGEYVSSIEVESSGILLAAHLALRAARELAEATV